MMVSLVNVAVVRYFLKGGNDRLRPPVLRGLNHCTGVGAVSVVGAASS